MNKFNSMMKTLALGKGLDLCQMINKYDRNIGDHMMQVDKDLGATEWHQAFIVNAGSEGFTQPDDDRPERIIKSFFCAVSAFLSKVKTNKVDEASALILTDIAGGIKFAAIAEYHENEENPDEPGNWSLVYSFGDSDLIELEKSKTVKRYLFTSEEFKALINKVAFDIQSIDFTHSNYIYDACILVVDTIIQILDRECVEGEVVDIELPGYFIASVAVEDGEIIHSIVPDGFMKEVLKDDIALEAASDKE